MKKKIKIFITIEGGGLLGWIRGLFIKWEIRRSLGRLRELPLVEIEGLLIKVMTECGYREKLLERVRNEGGTRTFIKEENNFGGGK